MDETSPAHRDRAPQHAATAEAPGTPEQAILRLVRARGAEKSICPGEAARAFAVGQGREPAWREYLAEIRRAGSRLAADGQIDILRKGKPIGGDAIRGVVRFRLKPGQGSS